MAAFDLLARLESLGRPRLAVLGDLMLDRYIRGDAERISQEAPVIVLRADEQEARLGGAANVCQMLRGLDCEAVVAGVIGDDEAGREVRAIFAASGVDTAGLFVDPTRPTTVKDRFIGRAAGRHANQMLRVDRETRAPLAADVAAELLDRLRAQLDQVDALLIADYAKGVCTPEVLKHAIGFALGAGKPVLIDPTREGVFEHYRGATLLKPNRLEAQTAVGRKIQAPADALAIGRRLCDDLNLSLAVVTLDRDGMALVERSGAAQLFPIHARSVYDITGAGDIVLAMLGLCLASGQRPDVAVRLANVAAGLEVAREGVAIVARDEIRRELLSSPEQAFGRVLTSDEAARAAEHHRLAGRKVVFTNGCFDLLHVGHAAYLAEAAALGDVLIVGVNSDASVRRLKGPQRPIIHEGDRARMLAALECVDHVVVFDDDTPHRLLAAIRPDVLVKGGDYRPDQVVGHEVVAAYGGQVCVTRAVDGISTTRIVASIAQAAEPPPDDAAP